MVARVWVIWLLVGALLPLSLGQAEERSKATPQRVVSMNLCTDQLAMLIADEDQLVSVSALAKDPLNSSMADQAAGYAINHGRAEEIHLLNPDLVITGRFNAGPTVEMLRRLGISVVVFDPANSLHDIRDNLIKMGDVLGQPERAQTLVKEFDQRLAMLSQPALNPPRAALYFPNGYTRGDNTLLGDIVRTAGFANIAMEAGVQAGAHMSLEKLVMAAPDIIITGSRHDGKSRSENILQHPALDTAARWQVKHELKTSDWVCGTPQALAAVERIGALRGSLMGAR
ncbi:ABC transporter substrate-binding protein [Spiribacter sp. C176]|uniref:ABC transporter substrate-binding protein n=1 Tax=Spiribacter salilacus TaxID=2664894 RepID=A0A6N7QSN1_9GAMM|nr:ABC transporter substrate-binding protein [Spiribacter salilacus]MRH78148.1 ABC transporter substrate-binding protein [Spiribacter salilacus]